MIFQTSPFPRTFLFSLIFAAWALQASAQPPRPVISHEAPASVVGGSPLRLVARVSSVDPLQEVNLHLAQTAGAAPVVLPMQAAGAGVYSVAVKPDLFSGAASFRYYLEAISTRGARSETNWVNVRVIPAAGGEPESEEKSWRRPALIGAGAAVAIGAGVALASSGGGGDGDGGGGGGPDPADQILVRTASDQFEGEVAALPREIVVDVGGELAGRRINRVRVRLDFNAVDGGEDRYEVLYRGSTVITGRTSAQVVEQVDVVGGEDTRVVIRVTESAAVNGRQAFRWDSTLTFFLE